MFESRIFRADPGYNADRTADPGPAKQLAAAMVNVAEMDIKALAKRWRKDPNARPSKNERSAMAWIQNLTCCSPFGFRWCCDVVGVNFDTVHSMLMSRLRVAPQTPLEH